MPQLTRRETRPLLALLLIGALPLGVAGYLSYLDADPNIRMPARPATPAPNGFDLYVKAADLSAQPNPPVDASSDRNSPTISAAKGAIRYGRARRQAWYDGAAPAWAVFRRAQQTPTRDPYPYGAQAMPGYARLRELARNKSAARRLFILRGEPDRAVNSALDCIAMSSETSRGGAMISRLVAGAVSSIALSPLSEAAPNSDAVPEQLSGPQARAAATRLEALLARRPSYTDAIKEERWMILGLLDRVFENGNWRAPDAFDAGQQTHSHEDFTTTIGRVLVSKRAVVANLNRGFDDALTELKAPYKAPLVMANSANRKPRPELDPISAQFVPGPNLIFNELREKTQLDLMLLRFALQAHRADKGAYPANLSALAPAYLRQIPGDGFANGKPFNYQRSGPTYRLWSVGPDAANDGGKAIADPFGAARTRGTRAPWNYPLPSVTPDSTGDVVARETR